MYTLLSLFDDKDIPLGLAVDMYQDIYVSAIEESSKLSKEFYEKEVGKLSFDYFASNSTEKCPFTDWKNVANNLVFTNGYIELFEEPILGLWFAYEAIGMLLLITPDGNTGYIQRFFYDKENRPDDDGAFLVVCEDNRVVFLTPDEY